MDAKQILIAIFYLIVCENTFVSFVLFGSFLALAAFSPLLESARVRMYKFTVAAGSTLGPLQCSFFSVGTVMQGGCLGVAGAGASTGYTTH